MKRQYFYPRPKDSMIATEFSFALKGFTLIEMLVVLAIIVILLLATLPLNSSKIHQTRIAESISLIKAYQPQIEEYFQINKEFPVDNEAAGLPSADRIQGNYLQAVYVVEGALQLHLGNKINSELKDKFVSLRPVFVPGVENAPVSWICGFDSVPGNMVAAGENRTDVSRTNLPLSCR